MPEQGEAAGFCGSGDDVPVVVNVPRIQAVAAVRSSYSRIPEWVLSGGSYTVFLTAPAGPFAWPPP